MKTKLSVALLAMVLLLPQIRFYKIAGRYKAQFDYAYRSYGILGSTDVFTFTFGWE